MKNSQHNNRKKPSNTDLWSMTALSSAQWSRESTKMSHKSAAGHGCGRTRTRLRRKLMLGRAALSPPSSHGYAFSEVGPVTVA